MHVTLQRWWMTASLCLSVTGCQLPNGWHTASLRNDPFLAEEMGPHHSESPESCGKTEGAPSTNADRMTARVPGDDANASNAGRASVSDQPPIEPEL